MTTITRTFAEDGSRYEIDCGPCSPDRGFCQVDTDQDASWFGIWTNPQTMVIASYMEGDITVERATCPFDYRRALVNTLTAYRHPNPDRGHAMVDLGLFRRAEMLDAFVSLGLASYVH